MISVFELRKQGQRLEFHEFARRLLTQHTRYWNIRQRNVRVLSYQMVVILVVAEQWVPRLNQATLIGSLAATP